MSPADAPPATLGVLSPQRADVRRTPVQPQRHVQKGLEWAKGHVNRTTGQPGEGSSAAIGVGVGRPGFESQICYLSLWDLGLDCSALVFRK